MPWCALITAVKNYNITLEKLQDFFFKTETKTKTKCSRSRPRLSFLSSRRLETKTLVSRTTSIHWHLITTRTRSYRETLANGLTSWAWVGQFRPMPTSTPTFASQVSINSRTSSELNEKC